MEPAVYSKEGAMIMWHSKHDLTNFLSFLKECCHFKSALKASFKKPVAKSI